MAGYATQLGNARNGQASGYPTVWRTADYEYCIVTRLDWHILICQRPRSGTSWTVVDVTNIALTGAYDPTFGPVEVSDSHYAVSMAVDGQGYIHLSGNMHQEPMKYIKSVNPHDISAWAQAPNPSNWLVSGADVSTYQAYEVFSDGTLIWIQDQSDTLNPVGRDQTMWRLGPNPGDTWEPCLGTGEIMSTINLGVNNLADTDSVPDRAYMLNLFVDKNDTLHCVFVWRIETNDPATMQEHFYVRSHDKGSTWENVLGEAVSAPFTYRQILDGVNGVGVAAIRVNGVSIKGSGTGGRCVDKDGNFHYVAWGSGVNDSSDFPQITPGNLHNHIWWDGTAWQIEQIIGYAAPTPASLSLLKDDLWLWSYRNTIGLQGYYGSNLTKRGQAGAAFRIRVGNCPPAGTPDGVYTFESGATYFPAPTHAGGYENSRHVTIFSLPDGDNPRVFSVGDGPRYSVG